jgi:hypothetical protein
MKKDTVITILIGLSLAGLLIALDILNIITLTY